MGWTRLLNGLEALNLQPIHLLNGLESPNLRPMRVNPAHIHLHNRCGPFTFLVDESRDITMKEQMTAVLCYVDKKGT